MMAALNEDTLVQATTADYLEQQLGCALIGIIAHTFLTRNVKHE